jgi:transposase
MRPRAGTDPVVYATKTALRTLGLRTIALEAETQKIDALLEELIREHWEDLLSIYGVGIDIAAALLVAAGDNPDRLRSEAAWAHLCGVAPIEASSGKVTRLRLNRGGDRQANAALWHIVTTRMSSEPRTRLYVERRSKEGRSKKEIIRVLKRYVAREVYYYLPRL